MTRSTGRLPLPHWYWDPALCRFSLIGNIGHGPREAVPSEWNYLAHSTFICPEINLFSYSSANGWRRSIFVQRLNASRSSAASSPIFVALAKDSASSSSTNTSLELVAKLPSRSFRSRVNFACSLQINVSICRARSCL